MFQHIRSYLVHDMILTCIGSCVVTGSVDFPVKALLWTAVRENVQACLACHARIKASIKQQWIPEVFVR